MITRKQINWSVLAIATGISKICENHAVTIPETKIVKNLYFRQSIYVLL